MLAEQIQADLTTAMKGRDELTVSVLRMARAAIMEAQVSGDEAHQLSDDDVTAILAREAKRREEAAAGFTEGGRTDRAERELAEREVLARYLPTPLGEQEVAAMVDRALAKGGFTEAAQMGLAMKAAMAEVDGRADGRTVSALVKARLSAG